MSNEQTVANVTAKLTGELTPGLFVRTIPSYPGQPFQGRLVVVAHHIAFVRTDGTKKPRTIHVAWLELAP